MYLLSTECGVMENKKYIFMYYREYHSLKRGHRVHWVHLYSLSAESWVIENNKYSCTLPRETIIWKEITNTRHAVNEDRMNGSGSLFSSSRHFYMQYTENSKRQNQWNHTGPCGQFFFSTLNLLSCSSQNEVIQTKITRIVKFFMTTTSIKDLNNVLQSLQVTENQLSILELWTRSYVHGVILKR